MDKSGLYSMNVRGLANKSKRIQIFEWLRNKSAEIFFLQETHSSIDSKHVWKDEWGTGNLCFSHGTSNSRGVCVLIKDHCDITINKMFQRQRRKIYHFRCNFIQTEIYSY